jgi:FkbM family methyltransferase
VTPVADATRERLSRWLWRRHGLAWQLPSGLHARVESLGDWVVYNEVFVDGAYDPVIDAMMAARPTDRPLVVLDLGAHVGYFSLRVADRVRRAGETARAQLTLVEGHPSTFRLLASRWRRQPLGPDTVVHLVQGLAGRRDGAALVVRDRFAPSARLAAPGERGVAARYVDLETLVPTGPVDLLKCDIEGAEASVIETYPALLTRVQRAAIEFHPRHVDVGRLVERLHEAGLLRRAILTDTPDGSLQWFER